MNLMGAMANIEFQPMGAAISFGFPTIPFGFIELPLAADLDDGWGPALVGSRGGSFGRCRRAVAFSGGWLALIFFSGLH